MSSLIYTPLRKPAHLAQISDEEIMWKLEDKKRARKYFSALPNKRYSKLYEKTKSPGTNTMLSGARGKIENILLTLPPFYDQKNPDVPVNPFDVTHYRTLLKHLSRQERNYTLLCHAS